MSRIRIYKLIMLYLSKRILKSMAIKSVKRIGVENVKVKLFWFLPFQDLLLCIRFFEAAHCRLLYCHCLFLLLVSLLHVACCD